MAQRDLPAASGFSLNNEEEVAAAVLAMQASGLVACFDDTAVPVYYIPQQQRLVAAYYRNTITHYFMQAAMSEIALAMCARDIDLPSEKTLRRNVMRFGICTSLSSSINPLRNSGGTCYRRRVTAIRDGIAAITLCRVIAG